MVIIAYRRLSVLSSSKSDSARFTRSGVLFFSAKNSSGRAEEEGKKESLEPERELGHDRRLATSRHALSGQIFCQFVYLFLFRFVSFRFVSSVSYCFVLFCCCCCCFQLFLLE